MAGYTNNTRGKPRGKKNYQGKGGGSKKTLPDRARAPYNFVPLAKQVVFPEWAQNVSHDVPFSDGASGVLEIEIRTETPLFIRGSDKAESFFRLPDGKPAIPGTSLRGMLRNVVEIASFGKMSRVNNHRYGIRDLNDARVYREHMSTIINKNMVPLVCAGWLQLDNTRTYPQDGARMWVISPCNFAKIEYKQLLKIAKKKGIRNFNPGKRQDATRKYRSWDDDLQVEVSIENMSREVGNKKFHGSYGVVKDGENPVSGTLVFTGQPNEYDPDNSKKSRNRKHHDFVFHGCAGDEFDVPYEVRRDFSFVHSSGGEQHRLDSSPNTEWRFMLEKLRRGEKVPVFYLLKDDGSLRAMGLAMMFRLAYKHSTLDTVRNAQEDVFDRRMDLAEAIFGRVLADGSSGDQDALAGRVNIETAELVEDGENVGKVVGVLGAPKASYYPNYLVQGGYPGNNPGRDKNKYLYKTYQDDDAQSRGWKRYPQRESTVDLPKPPKSRGDKINWDVATSFNPIRAGSVFRTKLHVFNLRPVELGALLWAIDFGGRESCRHGLGMAKAFGYGGVKLSVVGGSLQANDDLSELDIDTVKKEAVERYREYMESQVGEWEKSVQIHQLVNMATPVNDPDLRHMEINHKKYGNEFQGVKQAGKALPLRDKPISRERWRRETMPAEVPDGGNDSSGGGVAAGGGGDVPGGATEVDPILAEAQRAFAQGEHLMLFRRWMKEGGELEQARRSAAKKVIPSPGKTWRQKNADVWEWMRGS